MGLIGASYGDGISGVEDTEREITRTNSSTLVIRQLNIVITRRVDVYGGREAGDARPRPDCCQGTTKDRYTPDASHLSDGADRWHWVRKGTPRHPEARPPFPQSPDEEDKEHWRRTSAPDGGGGYEMEGPTSKKDRPEGESKCPMSMGGMYVRSVSEDGGNGGG